MPPSGGNDGVGEGSGRSMRRGVGRGTTAVASTGQDFGAEPGSRKRKVSVISRDTGSPVGSGEHLKVACDDSQRILNEIEDLRAQLDEDVKKLGYCEANQKLRVELALNAEEIQCLRMKNEEMHAKYEGMRKSNEELRNKNDDLVKQNEELQDNNNGLVKQNEVLQTSSDCMKVVNGELQDKNDGLVKNNIELQTMSDGLRKGNRELQAKNDSLMKQNEELQDNTDGLTKQNEEVQAKNDYIRKQNEMLQAKNVGFTKWIEELGAKNDGQRKRSEELQAKNDSLTKWNNTLQAKNDSMRMWNKELEAKNDGFHKNIKEILENKIDTKRKHLLQLEELYSTIDFPTPQLEVGKRMLHKSSVEANHAALKEEVAAYAASLEHTRKKNKVLESKKASGEQLVAMLQQVQDVSDIGFDDIELDTRICDLMVTGCKSKSRSKKNKERRRDTVITEPECSDDDGRVSNAAVNRKSKRISKPNPKYAGLEWRPK